MPEQELGSDLAPIGARLRKMGIYMQDRRIAGHNLLFPLYGNLWAKLLVDSTLLAAMSAI